MMTAFQEAQNARQKRILSSAFNLPLIVWIVIDLGVFVFAALMMISLPNRPRTALVLIGVSAVHNGSRRRAGHVRHTIHEDRRVRATR